MEPSHYQKTIYQHLKSRGGNCAVKSVAGSGKTHSAIEGIGHIPRFYTVLLGAFNRDIKEDFMRKGQSKNYTHVTYSTYNGFGWGICNKGVSPLLDENKTWNILESLIGQDQGKFHKYKGPVKRLVSLFKNLNIHTVQEAISQYNEIIDHHDITPPDTEDFEDYLFQAFGACISEHHVMDYDDQKYMPLHLEMNIPVYDYVVIDELQDTCRLEFELLKRASRGGMFTGLGDPDQSIYGFKGAVPEMFAEVVREMKMKELPLSICYRCPVNVINEAKKIVPRIEAAPGAKLGSVDTVKKEIYNKQVMEGDFVICRTTAPLVKDCLEKIREGKNGKVRGRALGENIIELIERVSTANTGVELFLNQLNDYVVRRVEMLGRLRREADILRLHDQADTVRALTENCSQVSDIISRINSVFCDDKARHKGIDYLTVHKAKGLQNKKVHLLRSDLLPHPNAKLSWMRDEEKRLQYVAITRAESEFYYVMKGEGER